MYRVLFMLSLIGCGVSSLHSEPWEAWSPTAVPGAWGFAGSTEGAGYDGFAWYRCVVEIPEAWRGSRLLLVAEEVGDVDEAYVNGSLVGANGSLPPLFSRPASRVRRPFVIDPDLIRYGEPNLIAWRIYDESGAGGILKGPVHLSRRDDALDLAGQWLVRKGDVPAWADWFGGDPDEEIRRFRTAVGVGYAGVRGIVEADKRGREEMVRAVEKRFEGNTNVHSNVVGKGQPKDPDAARSALELAPGLAVDTVLHEPLVRQPLFVDFDERGRLWVVQYIQYPDPAGLEVLTWDQHLRKVFDQVPPPPPYRRPEHQKFIGRDRISFHEDSDGDGVYDRHGVFVDGLNLVTSLAFGRGGVWVLNPPYLLFYPDADGDDRPDGDPVVHLSGFGLEDTHSIANSLKWGPDGWLYGAVGSTVTARVKVERSDSEERHSFFGQNIWRYHPERLEFELFAEGGWNTFGVDFDDRGRLYSGTNGNLQAVYFVQGGYYQKSFGKHGPHTNPYTYGHFYGLPIEGERVRLVHQWVLYESGRIPSLEGHFVGGNALANKVHALRIVQDGSTFRTVEIENPVKTGDKWFRPVHATVGPDGAIYLSDWYDARITHVDPRDNWDRDRGRVYRLRAKDAGFSAPQDLRKLTAGELVARLKDPNQWLRRTVQRMLADRQDQTVSTTLQDGLLGDDGPLALESLWALHHLGRFDDSVALQGLSHGDAFVRMWATRLLGDPKETLSPGVFARVLQLAREETNLEVVSQLAATAQRLPMPQGLPLVQALIGREEVAEDSYVPQQIWWALEAQLAKDATSVVNALDDPGLWHQSVFQSVILERLGRRFMAERSEDHLEICARLLRDAPDAVSARRLAAGMERALVGSAIESVPNSLEEALRRLWENFPLDPDLVGFAVRIGSEAGKQAAREFIGEARHEVAARSRLVQSLSEIGDSELLRVLLPLIEDSGVPSSLRVTGINALRRYREEGIALRLVRLLPRLSGDLEETAQSVLAGRSSWAGHLLRAVDEGLVSRESVRYNNLLVMQRREDPLAQRLIEKHWGTLRQPEAAKLERMAAVRRALSDGRGDVQAGRRLFEAACGVCHRLFETGKSIGPELTGYERDNLEFLLPAIIDPSLALREEYELVSVTLRREADEADATVVTGFITALDDQGVTVTDLVGNPTVIAKRDIAGQERSRLSAMPEGLLDAMTDQQIRDLFSFIQKETR